MKEMGQRTNSICVLRCVLQYVLWCVLHCVLKDVLRCNFKFFFFFFRMQLKCHLLAPSSSATSQHVIKGEHSVLADAFKVLSDVFHGVDQGFLADDPPMRVEDIERFSVLGAVELVQMPHAVDDLGDSLGCIKPALLLGHGLVAGATRWIHAPQCQL